METVLKSIQREPEEGSIVDLIKQYKDGEQITIHFKGEAPQEVQRPRKQAIRGEAVRNGRDYVIKVRQWMTKPASPDFDFMSKWNNDVPMPMRVMRGRVLKETRGMVYMDLRAEPHRTDYCMRCGRALTHPVSRLYGIGPECGGHYHINPFNTEEELKAALDEVRQKLDAVRWRGWIAKSGIEQALEVNS